MKLWEVIKELSENPKKKFEYIFGNQKHVLKCSNMGYFYLDIYYDNEIVESKTAMGGFNGNIDIKWSWQEVKQPVTWQEAIQAWLDGKRIKLEKPVTDKSGILGSLIGPMNDGIYITKEEFEHGKWYIKE